jgi:hypothetical protein
MQNAEWIALLRQLPKELQSQLVIVAQNRTDISVEAIFRFEPTFMVIRGRQGGTTETGLLFMFPYDQISSVFVNREVKEEEVEAMFKNMAPVARLGASQTGANGKQKLPPSQQAAAPPAPAPVATQVRPPGADPSSVARNNLLERLRAARNAALPPSGKQ